MHENMCHTAGQGGASCTTKTNKARQVLKVAITVRALSYTPIFSSSSSMGISHSLKVGCRSECKVKRRDVVRAALRKLTNDGSWEIA